MNRLQSASQVFEVLLDKMVAFLPGLLVGLFLIFIGWALGRFLAMGAKHLMRLLKFSEVMERAGWSRALADAEVTASPADFVGRLVFWGVFIVFLILGADNFGLRLAVIPLDGLIAFVPRILGAVVLLFLGSVIAGVAGGAVGTALARIDFEHHRVLAGLARGLVLLVTIMMAIEHLGFEIDFLADTLTNLLTIVVAAVAIAFAFGSREIARNVLAGYYARERFLAGDHVRLAEGEGEIVGIGTISTEVETPEGGAWIIPNHRLVESAVHKGKPDPGDAAG